MVDALDEVGRLQRERVAPLRERTGHGARLAPMPGTAARTNASPTAPAISAGVSSFTVSILAAPDAPPAIATAAAVVPPPFLKEPAEPLRTPACTGPRPVAGVSSTPSGYSR